MPLAITQVDAFTAEPFAGNPAAVVVFDQPSAGGAGWMRDVAREMNLAETAFLVPEGGGVYGLRWFTPTVEVDLCGHATLAAAHVLWESGRLDPATPARFATRSGRLTAALGDDGWITLDFPADRAVAPVPPLVVEPIARALRLDPGVVVATRRGRFDLLVEVATARDVRAARPDFGLLAAIEARGVIVTSRSEPADEGRGSDFTSRFFGPRVGVDEDPVTGSAHCLLGPYWANQFGRTSLVGYQASSRGGVVRVTVAGDRVLLGGQAVTVLRGELTAVADPVPDSPPG